MGLLFFRCTQLWVWFEVMIMRNIGMFHSPRTTQYGSNDLSHTFFIHVMIGVYWTSWYRLHTKSHLFSLYFSHRKESLHGFYDDLTIALQVKAQYDNVGTEIGYCRQWIDRNTMEWTSHDGNIVLAVIGYLECHKNMRTIGRHWQEIVITE